MDLGGSAAHHLSARYGFIATEDVLRVIVAVDVCGDEVHGNLVVYSVANETIDPGSLGRRRSADAQTGIDRFDCFRGGVVKLVVGLLLRIAGPEIQVRLVPYFEVPPGDFVDSVSCNEMLGEVRDHLRPFAPVLGGRNDRVIPEDMLGGLGGEPSRHKA